MKAGASALALALVGCGGGGDSTAATGGSTQGASAEGVYGGALTGSAAGDSFELLVLENGEYWAMYGSSVSGALLVGGFVQGTGTSSNGTFSSTDAKDFGSVPPVSGSVDATYDAAKATIAGSVKNAQGSIGFSGGPIAGSSYDYGKAASLADVTGEWTLTDLTGESISLTVQADGSFGAASTDGCGMSGGLKPRASGKNVFDVGMTFDGQCALPNQTATGIAVAYPLANGMTQLVVGLVDATRSHGAAAFGSR